MRNVFQKAMINTFTHIYFYILVRSALNHGADQAADPDQQLRLTHQNKWK